MRDNVLVQEPAQQIQTRAAHLRASVDRTLIAVVAVTAVVLLLLMPQFLKRLDPLTGDEPFYVMTAISIVRDRNLDETENYARRDYDEFYPQRPLPHDWNGWSAFPQTLPPHPAVTDREGLYTKHGLGLSLLIALPYEALGRFGAVLVVYVMAVALAANMYLFAIETGIARRTAAVVAIGLCISLPIAPYALLIFPEVPAALLLLYAVRRATNGSSHAVQLAFAGAAIGFLPWLHQRFSPTAAALSLVLLAGMIRRRDIKRVPIAAIPIASGALTIVSYNLWLYGSPLQNRSDHAGFSDAPGTINGFFGLLLDAQWGLLIMAPIYLMCIAGFPTWARLNKPAAVAAMAAVLPYIAVVAAYKVWWGEWGPPARYLVPIVPLAIGSIGVVIQRYANAGKAVAIVLACPSILLGIVATSNPQRLYHHPDGKNRLWERIDDSLGTKVAEWLVVFQPFAMSELLSRAAISSIPLVVLAMGIWLALRAGSLPKA